MSAERTIRELDDIAKADGWPAGSQAARLIESQVAEIERLRAALAQACTNLATIRPHSMLREGEDSISLGEAAERWQALVLEQADIAIARWQTRMSDKT